jgi:hypothetical protein
MDGFDYAGVETCSQNRKNFLNIHVARAPQ